MLDTQTLTAPVETAPTLPPEPLTLESKLDTPEKLAEAISNSTPHVPQGAPSAWSGRAAINTGEQTFADEPWWLKREVIRLIAGVYQTTEVIDYLNKSYMAPHVLHIAKGDDALVAYTATTEDGQRDRQVRTTMGRFLRKHCITLSDASIQQMEQDHYAEVKGLFLQATTRYEIRHVYMSMLGDTGCMRYPPTQFGIANDIHPSAVYAAPGISVAYTENADGEVLSRSIIYDNPQDPADKRYVRVFGAPVLTKLLVRAGYRMGSLVGAQLAKIPFVNGDGPQEHRYVVPYLDGPGGNQNNDEGVHVEDEGDPNYIRVVSRERAALLVRATGSSDHVARAKSTSARVYLEPAPSMDYVSALSGLTFDRLTDAPVKYWEKASESVKTCSTSELREAGFNSYRVLNASKERESVWAPVDTAVFQTDGWGLLIDCREQRERAGFVALTATFYPRNDNAPVWAPGSKTVQATVEGETHTIMREDALLLLPQSGDRVYAHKSALQALRKAGYVRCSTVLSTVTMIHRLRPTAMRSKGGTMFDTDIHDRYVRLIEGGWVPRQDTRNFVFLGKRYYTERTAGTANITALPDHAMLEAFKAHSIGVEITSVIDGLVADGLTEEAIHLVKKLVEGATLRLFLQVRPHSFRITTLENGAKTIGSATYDTFQSWAEVCDTVGVIKGMSEEDLVAHSYTTALRTTVKAHEVLQGWVRPFMEMLDNMAHQKAMEAAGQQRLDAIEPATPPETTPEMA